ncbi:MAG: hypothetical protein LIO57_06505 [Oscillospiraceae bacterium]|nr:hypothetical protein [Oscillospiraceae bacterium]
MARTKPILSDETLGRMLNKDERILWKGKPQPYRVLDKEYTTAFIARCAICLVGAAACIVGGLLWSRGLTAAEETGMVAAIILIFAYIALLPYFDEGTITARRTCVITDKRVLVCEGSKAVNGMNRAGLKVKIVESETPNCIHAAFGKAVDAPPRKYRLCCLAPRRDGVSDTVCAMAFYNVKDSQELRSLLLR